MAKSRSKSGRDHNTIASIDPLRGLLLHRSAPLTLLRPVDISPLDLDDGRQWHPEFADRPFSAAPRYASRPVAKQRPAFSQPSQTKGIIAFADPTRVTVCVRRGIRREVLHALNKTGGRGGKQRPRRMRPSSSISCR